jgi:2-succinyl-5-enolpyruvyl-6-hydroxy-3-cyclohexene-1-carboxylate synthase
VFSPSYVRWFRDIASSTDDISIALALSDANHAVTMASQLKGPVHLNIQFQENLAPESGKIRGDNRLGSTTRFSHTCFTDVPGFLRCSVGGNTFVNQLVHKSSYPSILPIISSAAYEVAVMLIKSRRGLLVVGSTRGVTAEESQSDSSFFAASVAHFAEFVGIPVICGAQSAQLRFQSAMVIPFGGK